MLAPDDFIFTNDLREACSPRFSDYCGHILCLAGSARFEMDDTLYNMVANEVFIPSTPKPVQNLVCSDDLRIEALMISWRYLSKNQPKSDYQSTAYLATVENPVYPVLPTDIVQIQHDFHEISLRLSKPYNNFFDETLRREVELMVLDFYDMHSRSGHMVTTGLSRESAILSRFVALLQKGLYKENRRVDYYASLLCISPKYLSEACVSASGRNASYWIEYFTADAIGHELRDTDKALQEIADEYGFSSVSYFSRYVKEHFGASPSEYRGRKLS